MSNLFVYGTLKNGKLQAVMPEVAPYLKRKGKGFVKATLYNVGEFPGAIKESGNSKVYGEILEISSDKKQLVLDLLDEYEELNDKQPEQSLFIRKMTLVNGDDGKKTRAWIYWYNKDVKGLKEIENGRYK